MNSLEQLSQLPFIKSDLLNSSTDIQKNSISFKFPIQHQLSILKSIHPNIQQDIPRFETIKQPHPKIKNIIAIASGKGGVGKSTITYYLALALQHMGAKVGVLDADIYGPSQSILFNLQDKPEIDNNKQLIPFERHGVQVMSIGTLSSARKAIVWRGPMISQGLIQLYQQTAWGELDYLLIDLPPGTGDIPLTLVQKMPLTSAIMIGNPHPLAKLDVDKCEQMFQSLKIPIVATIINQTTHYCPHCKAVIVKHEADDLSLPHNPEFQSMEAKAFPEFIALAETITQKLTQYNVRKTNPFDTIEITQTGK